MTRYAQIMKTILFQGNLTKVICYVRLVPLGSERLLAPLEVPGVLSAMLHH